MDQVSADLLLMIFKKLNSKEMVSVMRVERKWIRIIDENQALWRQLVLPPKMQKVEEEDLEEGWGLQALEVFDRKSNSTLRRVSMNVANKVDSGSVVETLEKSKDSLQFQQVRETGWNGKLERALEENLWKFPNLVECRLNRPSPKYHKIKLQLLERDEEQEDDNGSSLRILWIPGYSEKLFKSHLYLLDNLVSLKLERNSYGLLGIKKVLGRPSRTLKHLQISLEEVEEPQTPTLSFPNLKFLDIFFGWNFAISVFPLWMKLPSLSTLVIRSFRTPVSLPACLKLCLVGLFKFDELSGLAYQCPELVELKMDLSQASGGDDKLSARERIQKLSLMLSERKVNVENGTEIEGVRMVNLKTLVIPFKAIEGSGLKEVGLSKLRESVEEVIDLHEKIWEGSEIIEMEV